MDTFEVLKRTTAKLRDHGRLAEDLIARLPELSTVCTVEGYTEEKIQSLVYRACAYCLARYLGNWTTASVDEKTIKVEWVDFEEALRTPEDDRSASDIVSQKLIETRK